MTVALREADVKRHVLALLRGLGCRVYLFSQSRASHQTPGIPDAYIFPPFGKPAFWWEAKAPDGNQRPDQAGFQGWCERARVAYILGGLPEIHQHLRKLEVL